jgi:hypothetical protein
MAGRRAAANGRPMRRPIACAPDDRNPRGKHHDGEGCEVVARLVPDVVTGREQELASAQPNEDPGADIAGLRGIPLNEEGRDHQLEPGAHFVRGHGQEGTEGAPACNWPRTTSCRTRPPTPAFLMPPSAQRLFPMQQSVMAGPRSPAVSRASRAPVRRLLPSASELLVHRRMRPGRGLPRLGRHARAVASSTRSPWSSRMARFVACALPSWARPRLGALGRDRPRCRRRDVPVPLSAREKLTPTADQRAAIGERLRSLAQPSIPDAPPHDAQAQLPEQRAAFGQTVDPDAPLAGGSPLKSSSCHSATSPCPRRPRKSSPRRTERPPFTRHNMRCRSRQRHSADSCSGTAGEQRLPRGARASGAGASGSRSAYQVDRSGNASYSDRGRNPVRDAKGYASQLEPYVPRAVQ